MDAELTLKQLVEEMRNKGSLPALSETVLEISRLVRRPESGAPELAAVIMRDCGLASNLLATVNSAYYAPRFPVRTISAAVTYLGFDNVYMLALGLGLLRHTMASLQKRNLLKLYATAYFSGCIAMCLARDLPLAHPEEIFIAGLLYRLPGMSLAHAFPRRFQEMERRVNEAGEGLNAACSDIFGAAYDDICDAILALYNLPVDVERIICRGNDDPNDRLMCLVSESATLAAMLFGDRQGGSRALRKAERRIGKLLDRQDFSIPELLHRAFTHDGNVKHFFDLDAADVEMMVNLLEWGKTSPMAVVTRMNFGDVQEDAPPATEDPEALIGHFLTELALCRRRGDQINQLLMLAQEGLFRCLPDSEIITAFLSADKRRLEGRFYVGRLRQLKAQDFSVALDNTDAAIVRCLAARRAAAWQAGSSSLGLPFTPFGKIGFQCAYLSPIVVNGQSIGLCFAVRLKAEAFSDREQVWIDAVVGHIAAAFADGCA